MGKVLGVGGIFFKAEDPKALGQWYQKWLGVEINPEFGGSCFFPDKLPDGAYTVWSPFKKDTDYINPSKKDFMINFLVDNLDETLSQVEQGGAEVCGKTDDECGAFGWFIDPEGNKIELWQPKA